LIGVAALALDPGLPLENLADHRVDELEALLGVVSRALQEGAA
jgi:hypothetical protein